MPTFTVILRPEPSTLPTEIRLRRFLKAVLRERIEVAARRYGLRCTSIAETHNASAKERADVEGTGDTAEAAIVQREGTNDLS